MFARTSAVILGLVGAFALGLTIGPQIDADRNVEAAPVAAVAPDTVASSSAVTTVPAPAPPRLERVLPADAKRVQKQVKLLLNRGADVEMAADGFHNARELMTVAYAARNTDIPFVLLKHRVLNERKSLGHAISESRPELNEAAEVSRARAEAKADLARISS